LTEVPRLPPIDGILRERGLDNAALVRASTEQLTFKQVQKARAGRPLTANIRAKITRALNACGGEIRYEARDLFHGE
jgi:hypothetical protein